MKAYIGNLEFLLLDEVLLNRDYVVFSIVEQRISVGVYGSGNMQLHFTDGRIIIDSEYNIFVAKYFKDEDRGNNRHIFYSIHETKCLFDFDMFIQCLSQMDFVDVVKNKTIRKDQYLNNLTIDMFWQFHQPQEIDAITGIDPILWPFLQMSQDPDQLMKNYEIFCKMSSLDYPLDIDCVERILLPRNYSIQMNGRIATTGKKIIINDTGSSYELIHCDR